MKYIIMYLKYQESLFTQLNHSPFDNPLLLKQCNQTIKTPLLSHLGQTSLTQLAGYIVHCATYLFLRNGYNYVAIATEEFPHT